MKNKKLAPGKQDMCFCHCLVFALFSSILTEKWKKSAVIKKTITGVGLWWLMPLSTIFQL
jgi:hypothetical protein